MAKIKIYRDEGDSGKEFDGNCGHLSEIKDFPLIGNDYTTLVKVVVNAGTWRIWELTEFRGEGKDFKYGFHRDPFLRKVGSLQIMSEGGSWEDLTKDLDWMLNPVNDAREMGNLVRALQQNNENFMGAVKDAFHESTESQASKDNFDACASENQGAVYQLGRQLMAKYGH